MNNTRELLVQLCSINELRFGFAMIKYKIAKFKYTPHNTIFAMCEKFAATTSNHNIGQRWNRFGNAVESTCDLKLVRDVISQNLDSHSSLIEINSLRTVHERKTSRKCCKVVDKHVRRSMMGAV